MAKSGLAESRERAQALILAGKVRVKGETVRRPDRTVDEDAQIAVDAEPGYASRGALKLAPALDALRVDPAGRVCADIGASTGGFTDVLLRHGAARVYAVDVGRGLMHWRLRQDPRVVLMERVNARELESSAPDAEVVALFKPQFEVGRGEVGKGGIVRDQSAIGAALHRFRDWCAANGFHMIDQVPSEVAGAGGNREVFVQLGPVKV